LTIITVHLSLKKDMHSTRDVFYKSDSKKDSCGQETVFC
jgi:hypothetical protein